MENTEEIKKVEDTLEKPLFNVSKVLIITIIAIAAIILFIFLYIFTISKNENKAENNFKEIFQNKDFKDFSLEEKLKLCLEKEEFDLDCNLLFSSPDVDKKCPELGKLNDKCFYKHAVINHKKEYCESIVDKTLKQNCELETGISSGIGIG